jgi:5-methylcytosine-specific restriction enzyme A
MTTNHPFTAETGYFRDSLVEFVGSRQEQTGVIYGPSEPGVVIITSGGRHSKNAGYEDHKNEDGSWIYFGQGRKGDQNPNKKGNAMLISGERSILLFETREPDASQIRIQGSYKKKYIFKGEFLPLGHDIIRPSSGPRKGLATIRIELAPVVADIGFLLNAKEKANEPSLRMRRDKILARQMTEEGNSTKRKIQTTIYERSIEIREYALNRAGGICEMCNKHAPFVKKDGSPFLEVHHIKRLADYGDDKIENVIGICPNCHREAHHGKRRDELAKSMLEKVMQNELELIDGIS